MTKLERKAAMIVAAATAGVIVSGVKLIKKHTRYLAEKAAATFGTEDGEDRKEDLTDEAEGEADLTKSAESTRQAEPTAENEEDQADSMEETSAENTKEIQEKD